MGNKWVFILSFLERKHICCISYCRFSCFSLSRSTVAAGRDFLSLPPFLLPSCENTSLPLILSSSSSSSFLGPNPELRPPAEEKIETFFMSLDGWKRGEGEVSLHISSCPLLAFAAFASPSSFLFLL